MRLETPFALFLLLLVLPLLYLSRRWRRPAAISYPTVQELRVLPPTRLIRLRCILPVLRTGALLLGILALTRPQWQFEATEVYQEGVAIDMVIDVSRSMSASELLSDGRQVSRLDIVKQSFRTFLQGDAQDGDHPSGREGDLIGLVVFARYADNISPLTLDHELLITLLEQIEIVTLPHENGTAIGEALASGVDRLRHSDVASRVMVLLTDGSNNAGETDPLMAAQIAKAFGIKIYTIGTGTQGVAPVAVPTPSGGMELRSQPMDIDEAMLTQVATLTGGRYFRAADSTALQGIYAEIDRLEKSTTVAKHYQQYAEGFPLMLLLALGLLVMEIVLVNTWCRTIP